MLTQVQLRGYTADNQDSRVSTSATNHTRLAVPAECRAAAVVDGVSPMGL